MKNSMLKRKITFAVIPACTAFLLGGAATSCSDELLTGQPTWLGESIYEELESRGNFKETLKLINAQEEDYASMLKRTGSKTLFVADDAAWQRFYQNNPWGVTSLEDMTAAQRKLIFKSNMVNSAYLVELLSNIPGDTPLEGACMRRSTATNLMDSVPYVPSSEFPVVNPNRRTSTGAQIDYWADVRDKKGIYMLQDSSVASMIHFMPRFMQNNNITSDDVEFLTNGEIKSNVGAFVNGKVILENTDTEVLQDITCQNGYIHVLEDVALPLDNMANVIAQNPQFSIYRRLLDRFSYPHYSPTVNTEYHRQYGGELEDSVFVRRYFNNHSNFNFTKTDKKDDPSGLLPYDPGWNHYFLQGSNATESYFQRDAAVMLVPTDEAMLKYLDNDGSDLKERYGNAGPGATAWDNAPDAVILPLLENTMLTSLKAAVPSVFSSINNTASETMGVTKADIDSVLWACNGVIYQTNKVYVAPDYVSVYYPCLIRDEEDMHIVYSTIEWDNKQTGAEGFRAYLKNMGSKYSFVIPTDNALQTYYDPVSYKRQNARREPNSVLYKFSIVDNQLSAAAYSIDWSTLDDRGCGTVGALSTEKPSTGQQGDAFNRFKDIINSSLATSLFTPGQRFYQAKNGGPIIADWNGTQLTGVAGSFQYERGYFIPVIETFDKSTEGNGRSYIIDEEPLMSTFVSPYAALTDTLRERQFGEFGRLLAGTESIVAKDAYTSHATMDYCLKNLNNYHYTIYVPTNESLQELIAAHKLPTWDDVDAVNNCINIIEDRLDATTSAADSLSLAEDLAFMTEQATVMSYVITNFVTYHIQDNSVYIEGAPRANDVFESSCLDTLTTRFVKLYVDYELGGEMTITDNSGNKRTVNTTVTDDAGRNCYNVLTRQYFFDGKTLTASKQIFSSSFAVLHQINLPLEPFKVDADHPDGSYYNPAMYDKVQEMLAKYPVDNDTPNPIKRKR